MAGRIGRTYSNRPSNIILPQSKSLSRQTIKTWKQALELALASEDPSRLELMEVYTSILLDNHLASIIETRILKVLRSKFRFIDEKGNENDDVKKLFEKQWFEQFLSHIMWSKFKGTTVVELWDMDENMELIRTGLIPRENCNFIKGFFTKEAGDDTGTPYKEGSYKPYYIQVGDNRDLGLLKDVAPAAIAKKFAQAAWLELTQKYGIPPRYVTTDSYSSTRHQELANMMHQMVNSHYAVLQGNEKIEILNGIQGDPHEVFDKLIVRYNSEKTKRVLGHDSGAGTQDTKGTYGSLQIMQDVANDRHESDKRFCKYIINNELIPRLIEISPAYKPLTNLTYDWDNFQELSANELITAVKDLSSAGFIPDIEYITQKTGIPIIGMKQQQTFEPTEEDEKKKSKLNAFRAELDVFYQKSGNFEPISANSDRLKYVFDDFAKAVFHNTSGKTPYKFVLKTAEYLSEALQKELTISASSKVESAFYASLQSNIYVFSAAKTFAQYQELSALLTDENGKARSWQSFKDEAVKIHKKYNLDYLRTEFRTAQRTALLAGKWQHFEKTKHLFDLMFETAGDEKVRGDHAKLNGIVRPVDNGFWKTFYPPLDWNCRCTVRQVAKGTAITPNEKLQGLPKPDKSFRFNAGKQGVIFDNNHPYIKNFITNNKRELRAVEDYGLPSIAKLYVKGKHIDKAIKEVYTKKEAYDWFEKVSKDGVKTLKATVGKTSYNVELSKKQLQHIIEDNKDNRWKWAHTIPSILLDANEVYLINYGDGRRKKAVLNYRFIKYFKNKQIVTVVEIKNDVLQIKTSYEMSDETEVRRGVLLYTKK